LGLSCTDALGSAVILTIVRWPRNSIDIVSEAVGREMRQEADPRSDEQDCVSSGKMTIVYASNDSGVPNVAFQITDPRGRKIGYNPDTNRGWQEMPLAEAFLDCEQNDDTGELRECKGHIEICTNQRNLSDSSVAD
jgi:hypothetical protein